MPHRYKDELAKLEDIEALINTARDLVYRYRDEDFRGVGRRIQQALDDLHEARRGKISRWRREMSSH